MKDFLTALGLVLVIEGIVYAAFPGGMKAMFAQGLGLPDARLRLIGLIAALIGIAVVWLIRGGIV